MRIFLIILTVISLTGCTNPFEDYPGYWIKENTTRLDAMLIQEKTDQYVAYQLSKSTNFEPTGSFIVLKNNGEQLIFNGGWGESVLALAEDKKTLLLNGDSYKKTTSIQFEEVKSLFFQQEEEREQLRLQQKSERKKQEDLRLAQQQQELKEWKIHNEVCNKLGNEFFKKENELRRNKYTDENMIKIEQNKELYRKKQKKMNCRIRGL